MAIDEFRDWRFGQLIENVFGCLSQDVGEPRGSQPYCLFQVDNPAEIRKRLEMAYLRARGIFPHNSGDHAA